MRRRLVGLLLSLAGVGRIALGCGGTSDCAANATCAAAATGPEGGTTVGDGAVAYTAPPPPANCEPTADPKDAPACIDDGFALFVDGAGGIDTNPGTQQSPLKTISAAMGSAKLAGRIRVYACTSGVYDERVTLAAGVTLVGGFDCTTWKYGTQPTRIAPTETGVAFRVSASANRVQLTDLDIAALDGVTNSESSIAMVVSGAKADLRRLTITAGKGVAATYIPLQAGADHPAASPAAAIGITASPGITCNCTFGLTVGGAGGSPTATDKSGKAGTATPPPSVLDMNHPGFGGPAGIESGGAAGGAGDPGKAGAAPAPGAPPGTYDDNLGWVALAASAGNSGDPGVGGGGAGAASSVGGGGGGCGGCGGRGGSAGRGGGSSIALLASNADLALFACTLTGQDAGAGGVGGAAANGGAGALGSAGGSTAGTGGTGGPGGGGAGGNGGSGGVSTAIVNQKSTITPDASTKLLFGASGAGGPGGKLGAGGVNADFFAVSGVAGTTGATFTAQAMIEIP